MGHRRAKFQTQDTGLSVMKNMICSSPVYRVIYWSTRVAN